MNIYERVVLEEELIERRFHNCKNAFSKSLCNPWIKDNCWWETDSNKVEEAWPSSASRKADEICSECKHFLPKFRQGL